MQLMQFVAGKYRLTAEKRQNSALTAEKGQNSAVDDYLQQSNAITFTLEGFGQLRKKGKIPQFLRCTCNNAQQLQHWAKYTYKCVAGGVQQPATIKCYYIFERGKRPFFRSAEFPTTNHDDYLHQQKLDRNFRRLHFQCQLERESALHHQ